MGGSGRAPFGGPVGRVYRYTLGERAARIAGYAGPDIAVVLQIIAVQDNGGIAGLYNRSRAAV